MSSQLLRCLSPRPHHAGILRRVEDASEMLLTSYSRICDQIDLEQGGATTLHEEHTSVWHPLGNEDILSKSNLWRVHPQEKED
jgi:hypothetical protein